jgi:hypothetical protein
LSGSLLTLVHPDPQHTSEPAHAGPPWHPVAGTQLPPVHASPAGQARPHAPQSYGSVLRFVQPEGQHCSDPGQAGPPLQVATGTHSPPEHDSPDAHSRLQTPQFFGSVSMLVQPEGQHWSEPAHAGPPLQEVWALHAPPTHA